MSLNKRKRDASKLFTDIQEQLTNPNGFVQITTALKSWVYQHKHRDMFRMSSDGLSVLVQHGKRWNDIMPAWIRFGRYV